MRLHFLILSLTLFCICFPVTSHPTSENTSSSPLPHESLEECLIHNFYYDCSKCPCFPLGPQQNAWNLIIAFSSLAFSFIFILFFILAKPLRETPGNFVLIAAISLFAYSLSTVLENTSPTKNDFYPVADSLSCVSVGFVKILSSFLMNFYLFAFFGIYTITIKNPSKASNIKESYIHAVALILSSLFMPATYSFGAIGRAVDGNCGLKTIPGISTPIVGYGLLTVFSLCITCLARRQFVKNQNTTDKLQGKFAKHYLFYLTIISNIFLIIGIMSVIESLSVYSYVSNSANRGQGVSSPVVLIKLALGCFCPLLLMIARIREPVLKNQIKENLRYWLCCQRRSENQISMDSNDKIDLALESLNTEESLDIKQKLLPSHEEIPVKIPLQFKVIKENEKGTKLEILSSMLASLNYFIKAKPKMLGDAENHFNPFKKSLNRRLVNLRKKILVSNDLFKRNVPHVLRELRRRNKKLFHGYFTIHALKVFDDIIELDRAGQEINSSFNFIENYGSLFNNGYQIDENGRVLLYSSNKKFILKEISQSERKDLLKILPDYKDYLKSNPCSLLAPVYGVFTFEGLRSFTSKQEITMVLMRNTSQFNVSHLESQIKFDQVSVKVGTFTERIGNKIYTKYLDSLNEEKLPFDKTLKSSIMTVLSRDIDFLSSLKLFNYGLQVDVINIKPLKIEQPLNSSIILEADEWEEASQSSFIALPEDISSDQLYNLEVFKQGRQDSLTGKADESHLYSIIEIVDFWNTGSSKKNKNSIWKKLCDFRLKFKKKSEVDFPKEYGRKLSEIIEPLL